MPGLDELLSNLFGIGRQQPTPSSMDVFRAQSELPTSLSGLEYAGTRAALAQKRNEEERFAAALADYENMRREEEAQNQAAVVGAINPTSGWSRSGVMPPIEAPTAINPASAGPHNPAVAALPNPGVGPSGLTSTVTAPTSTPYVPEPLSLSMAGGAPSTGPWTDPTKLDFTLPADAYQVPLEGDIASLPPLGSAQADSGWYDETTGGEAPMSNGMPIPGQVTPGQMGAVQDIAQSFAQGQVPTSVPPTAATQQPTNLRDALKYKGMDAMISTVAGWPGLQDAQKQEIIEQLGNDLMADRLAQSKRGMFNQATGLTDAMLDKVDWTKVPGSNVTSATSTTSSVPNAAPVAAGINKILADAPPPPADGAGMDVGKLLEGKTVNEALVAISNLEGQFKYVSPAIRSQLIRELRTKKPGDIIKATGTFSKQIVPVSSTPQDMQPTVPGVLKDFGQAIGLTGGVKPSATAGS